MEQNRLVTNFDKSNGFDVSAKYVAINTANLVSQFENAGFKLTNTSAANVRKSERQGYQKHLFTFKHDDIKLKHVNDSVPQIILKNSYDGTSSLQVMLGIYRLVCSNGLVVGTTFDTVRVRHVGVNALREAIDGAFRVAGQAERAAGTIIAMQSKLLSQNDAIDFATNIKQLTNSPIDAVQLLQARREADIGMDLWSTLNRVQENIIRGGQQYTAVDRNGRVRRQSTRLIRSIERNVGLNRVLWTAAEELLAV